MARLGAWAALALLTLYLVFFGGGWQGIYSTNLRSFTIFLAGATFAGWVVVALRRPEWRPRSLFIPAICACLASLGVSTAFSRHPRLSVEYVGYAIVLAALYLLLVRILANAWFRARMATLSTALAVVIGGLFVALVIVHWIAWWDLVGRITVPPLRPNFESLVYGNPSAVMTMSVLLTAVAVASVGGHSRGRVIVSGGLVVLAGTVVVLSGSRAGWFAVAAAVIVSVLIALVREDSRAGIREFLSQVWSTAMGRSAVVGALLVGAAATIALGPALLRRAISGGEDLRITYALIAARLFGESPIVGAGPSSWVIERTRLTRPPEVDFYIPHAHNLPLQTLAELGVVGAAAGVVVCATLFVLVRAGLNDPDPTRRRWAWASLVTLVYFGAHQLLDLYVNMPAVLFAASLPIAYLDATRRRNDLVGRRTLPTRLAPGAAMVGAVLLAVAIGGLLLAEIPAARQGEAVALANDGDWSEAIKPASDAVALDPAWPPYQLTLGLTALRAGAPEVAASAFQAVVDVDDLPEAWLGLAAADVALGDSTNALDAVRKSLRLGYQRPATAMAAGDLALKLGDRSLAIEAFASAVQSIPSLAADPYWATLRDEPLLNEVVDRAVAIAGPDIRWEIRLMTGEIAKAKDLARSPGVASTEDALQIISAWEADPAAVGRGLSACLERPLDVAAVQWCARIEGRLGHDAERERYRAWAEAITGGASAAAAETRVSITDLVGRSLEGDVASFWGTYTYRRPTPWDILPPDLIHLTLK